MFTDYTSRKFYSKIGQATNASSKPLFKDTSQHTPQDITMDFIRSELEKAKHEKQKIRRHKRKKRINTSSFLSTTRETYMRAFKPTSSETPVPGKYSPNINFIKPSPSPVLRLRRESEKVRRGLVSLPSCIDTSVFECAYPKKTEGSPIFIQEKDLNDQAEERKVNRNSSLGKEPNFVSFEKQTKRLFLPVHSVADSRFDNFNYFPKISTKVKKTRVVDFNYYPERRAGAPVSSPGFYDYDFKVAKSSYALCNFDMSKVIGRRDKERLQCDTVNKDKVNESFKKVMPKTYVSSPCFEKTTDRNDRPPGCRSVK